MKREPIHTLELLHRIRDGPKKPWVPRPPRGFPPSETSLAPRCEGVCYSARNPTTLAAESIRRGKPAGRLARRAVDPGPPEHGGITARPRQDSDGPERASRDRQGA